MCKKIDTNREELGFLIAELGGRKTGFTAEELSKKFKARVGSKADLGAFQTVRRFLGDLVSSEVFKCERGRYFVRREP